MELLIGYLKRFPLEMEGGGSQMGKSTYTNGGCSKRTPAYDGGVKLLPF